MYTDYLHGIAERTRDVVDASMVNGPTCGVAVGEAYDRETRVSLTFRHLVRTIPASRLLGTKAR